MKIDWPLYRKEELKSWIKEMEMEQKDLDLEMEKQQKIREKHLIRFQIAKKVEETLSSTSYAKTIIQYQKKMDQTNTEVKDKLQALIQKVEIIEVFKKEIRNALEHDLKPLTDKERSLKKSLSSSTKKKSLKRKFPQWT